MPQSDDSPKAPTPEQPRATRQDTPPSETRRAQHIRPTPPSPDAPPTNASPQGEGDGKARGGGAQDQQGSTPKATPEPSATLPPAFKALYSQLRFLSQEIRPFNPTTAQQLSEIATALEKQDLLRLSRFDPRSLFDIRAIEEQALLHKLGGRENLFAGVEWLRNVLVLFPIIITWWGLYEAAVAYQKLVEANAALLDTPFLLLWEQGFGGGHRTFSELALWDVGFLVVILFLTGFIHYRRDIREAEAVTWARAIRTRLEWVVWEWHSKLALTAPQDTAAMTLQLSQVIQGFHLSAQGALEHIRREMARLGVAAASREAELGQLQEFTTAFDRGAGKMVQYGKSLEKLGGRLEGLDAASNTLQSAVRSLEESLVTLSASQTALQDELAAVADQQEQMVVATDRSVKELHQAVTALKSTMQQHVSQVTALNENMADLEARLTHLLSARTLGVSRNPFNFSFWVSLSLTIVFTLAFILAGLLSFQWLAEWLVGGGG